MNVAIQCFSGICMPWYMHPLHVTAERRKDSQSQSQPSPNVFLIEHLEWLLKIGCSVDKIMEWAREKQQNQAVETPSCFSSYNGIDADIPYGSTIPDSGLTDLAHGTFNPQQASGQLYLNLNSCVYMLRSYMYVKSWPYFHIGSNSDNTSVTKQRKRKQSDKNQQPRPKKSRKKGILLIYGDLILHGTYIHCRYFTSSIRSYQYSPRHRPRKTTTAKKKHASK